MLRNLEQVAGPALAESLGVDGVFLESFVETQIVRVVYHRNKAHLGYCAQYWVWCECIWKEKIAHKIVNIMSKLDLIEFIWC